MDVSSSTPSSPKIIQYIENDLKNYLFEYGEYQKIQQKFREIISDLALEANFKIITGLMKRLDQHSFGKGEYFAIAYKAFKLKEKDPFFYNTIVSNRLQNTCKEYHADRKTMKLALSVILTSYMSKHQQYYTDAVDALIGSLSPKVENLIDFASILEILEINDSSESEPSSPHSLETPRSPTQTPRKNSRSISPNTLRRLTRKMSSKSAKLLPKRLKDKDNVIDARSTPLVTFADRNRSNSSPSFSHIIIKSPNDVTEIHQNLELIQSVLKDSNSTVIKSEDGSLLRVQGHINLDTIKIILKEFESYALEIQEIRDKNLFYGLLRKLTDYDSVKEFFALRKDLFQRYLKLYIGSKVEDWCIDKACLIAVMNKYKGHLTNFMVSNPFYFKSRNEEININIWELVDETKVQTMAKVAEILFEPFYKASQELIKETKSLTKICLDKSIAGILEKHQKECEALRKNFDSESAKNPDNLEFLLHLGNHEQRSLIQLSSENSELDALIKLINQVISLKKNYEALEANQHSFSPDQLLKIINLKLESMNSYLLAVSDSVTAFYQYLFQNENLKKFFALKNSKGLTKIEILKIHLKDPRANLGAIVDALD